MAQDLPDLCGVFELLADAVLLIDTGQQVVFANSAAGVLFGWRHGELVGAPLDRFIAPAKRGAHADQVRRFFARPSRQLMCDRATVDVFGSDGLPRPVSISLACVETSTGRLAAAVIRDGASLHATLDAERARADIDTLTELGNRRYFTQQLDRRLAEQAPAFGLLFLDLDGFKGINDTWGHAVGDRVLQIVGRRLRSGTRHRDVVARLGGDEFVMLTSGSPDDATLQRMAAQIRARVEAPIRLDGRRLRVGVSIGWAIAPRDGRSAAELVHHADKAMYAAKQGSSQLGVLDGVPHTSQDAAPQRAANDDSE